MSLCLDEHEFVWIFFKKPVNIAKNTKREKMLKRKDPETKYDVISQEIEEQLEQVYAMRKEEVERELEEKIKRIKKQAEKKIEHDKKEIDKEKKELRDYTALIDKIESAGKEYIEEIDGHLNRAAKHREEMLRLIGTMKEELIPTIELNHKLDQLQQDAEGKAGALKNQLKEKYGIEAQIPESRVLKEKVKFDLSKETEKLEKIEELLMPPEFPIPEEKAEELKQPA